MTLFCNLFIKPPS